MTTSKAEAVVAANTYTPMVPPTARTADRALILSLPRIASIKQLNLIVFSTYAIVYQGDPNEPPPSFEPVKDWYHDMRKEFPNVVKWYRHTLTRQDALPVLQELSENHWPSVWPASYLDAFDTAWSRAYQL